MSGDHDHAAVTGSATSPLAARVRAMKALLIEKGVMTEAEIQDNIAYMDSRSPANDAKLVARAWTDVGFKARLLSDGKAAAIEFGLDAVASPDLVVVENTPEVHNLIVCTLCSCYPRNVLGRPPDWYRSFEYRPRAVREPRAVMREFGFVPPDPTARGSPSTTVRPTSATWCCRCAHPARRAWARRSWRASSRGTASSAWAFPARRLTSTEKGRGADPGRFGDEPKAAAPVRVCKIGGHRVAWPGLSARERTQALGRLV